MERKILLVHKEDIISSKMYPRYNYYPIPTKTGEKQNLEKVPVVDKNGNQIYLTYYNIKMPEQSKYKDWILNINTNQASFTEYEKNKNILLFMVSNSKSIMFNIHKPEKIINENGKVKYDYSKKETKKINSEELCNTFWHVKDININKSQKEKEKSR